jgi:protein phosphatase
LLDVFSKIIKEALEVQHKGFVSLVKEAAELLCEESGTVGNMEVLGRLIKLKPAGKALVIGDLHGDLESLIDIIKGSNFMKQVEKDTDARLIFLGDYGDRGPYSAEIYYTVLKLKLLYPKQVLLLRGNHEFFWTQAGMDDLAPYPHDLPLQFQARFGKNSNESYLCIRRLFDCLYAAVLVEGQYLLVHGGVPSEAKTVHDFAFANSDYPRNHFLEDIVWGDPDETVVETVTSPRGAGKLFGAAVTTRILQKLGVKIIVRGHEPCEEGYKINHAGKVLTLFSRKGAPYFNSSGAYLEVDLSAEFRGAEELVPYIHKF